MVGRVGFEPTMFATRVRDLQSRALAAMRPTQMYWKLWLTSLALFLRLCASIAVMNPCT